METLWVDWLFFAGVILLPVEAGMMLVGRYTRTFLAALVGWDCCWRQPSFC